MKPKINENVEAHVIIGGNKQGKSSLVAQLIKGSFDKRREKVVVLNSSNPLAFAGYDYHEDAKILKRNWHGVIRYHNPAGYKQTLTDVYQAVVGGYLYNGAIVFDDCTKYIDPWPAEDIRNFLVDRRMYGLHLFFTTHALRFYPRFCRGMTNTITVFKTAETFNKPEEIRALSYPNSDKLFLAWDFVRDTPNDPKKHIQFHLTVDTGI